MVQQQAIRAASDPQAMEGPIDPATYRLGPGDGLYLNVYSAHSLDQDITVTPEGKLIVPQTGSIDANGLTINEAEKKIGVLLAREYRKPEVALSLRRMRTMKVSVLGDVLVPGVVTATAQQRLSEVVDRAGGFLKQSSLRNITVRRQDGSIRTKADLVKYFSSTDLSLNPYLEGGDVIVVPPVTRVVTLNGAVVNQGVIEFVEGDSLSTLISLARGFLPSAKPDSVEIARFDPQNPSVARRFYVNMMKHEDVALAEGDVIFVRAISQYHLQRVVSIAGEVEYPGKYSIELGETRLSNILTRAGGILPTGSIDEAAVIRRVGIGSWEQDPEWIRLQQMGPASKDRMSDDEYNYLTARMRQMGRTVMVVNFRALLDNHDASQDILMREEDSIWIPRARGFVNVTGSVNNQGNVILIENGTVDDYIEHAGGYASNADKSAVRIINARTSSYINPRSEKNYHIGPGDTIVVPSEHSDFWKNFASVTALTAQVITILAGIFLLVKK
jgi:protein involved in polysaccharide export with SLBB domain